MRHLTLASLSLASWILLGCGGSVTPEEGVAGDDAATVDDTGGGSSDGTPGSEDSSIVPPAEDGSIGPTDDAIAPPPPSDASAGTGAIKCGTTTCDSKTQDCCATFSSQKCVAKGTCTGGATLSCTDPSACAPGQVCCASGGGGGGGAKCTTTCTMGVILCATDADCKAAQKCLNGLGGTKSCRNPPPGGFDGGFGGFDAAFDTKAFGG